jgi:hypothetical protein
MNPNRTSVVKVKKPKNPHVHRHKAIFVYAYGRAVLCRKHSYPFFSVAMGHMLCHRRTLCGGLDSRHLGKVFSTHQKASAQLRPHQGE